MSRRPPGSGRNKERTVGQWEPLEAVWWETNVATCTFCGEMIPKRQWVAEHGGERRVFHSPECEQLYVEYWVPKHGYAMPTK